MCDKCGSNRIFGVSAKCSDCCISVFGDKEKDGYAPSELNIGGGDYVQVDFCLQCGKIQGQFPVSKESVARVFQS